ncbi:MAG TPA: CHRD domain-containing protein [Beijerinckia sp.]|jgi:hypothetical protein|nr:CHRD domain-containing protein [Beijerinckia sp.]
MFKFKTTPGLLAAALAGSFLFNIPARAETITFKTELTAGEETPPNTSKGTGTLTATFDTETKKLAWTVTYSDMTGPATAAHFHGPADRGQPAPPIVTVPVDKNPIVGSATLTDAQANELANGRVYFNIHTAEHATGEIRGQLLKGM